jgi:hypothetical protein
MPKTRHLTVVPRRVPRSADPYLPLRMRGSEMPLTQWPPDTPGPPAPDRGARQDADTPALDLDFLQIVGIFPDARNLTPALRWLRARLSAGPARIALVIDDWLDHLTLPRSGSVASAHAVQDLMDARRQLFVRAHRARDGTLYWICP